MSTILKANLVFYVNGKKIVDSDVDPEESLLTYLRKKLQLTGTKYGCGEGGCGACTVMISQFNRRKQIIENFAVTACLIPICYVHGKSVTSVEGIGSSKTSAHPIQERIAKCHGSQCGYCTPGMVMSAYALLRNNPKPTPEEIQNALQGNTCRCTGYRPILNAIGTFTDEGCCAEGKSCCKTKQNTIEDDMSTELYHVKEFKPYYPSQDPIFPPELQLADDLDNKCVYFVGPKVTWIRPVTLSEFFILRKKYSNASLVFGNTYLNLSKYSLDHPHSVVIAPALIPEFNFSEVTNNGITIGAAVTITELQKILRSTIPSLQISQTAIFEGIANHLNLFGGQQIRNIVACGSCIAVLNPVSDFILVLLAAEASVTLMNLEGQTKTEKLWDVLTAVDNGGFKNQTIMSIHIPFSTENEYFMSYKEMLRRSSDSAIVNAAFKIIFEPKSYKIASVLISYGNIAKKTILAQNTMNSLNKKYFTEEVLTEAAKNLNKDIEDFSEESFMTEYKKALVFSLFYKFQMTALHKLYENGILQKDISARDLSALRPLQQESHKNTYNFQKVMKDQVDTDAIGHPIMHASALYQAMGEAEYCDDIQPFEGQLYLAPVISDVSHGEIISVDPAKALKLPGVVSYIDHTDVPGLNGMGCYIEDEEIFATKKVVFKGQVIAAIVATTDIIARQAAKLVEIRYKDLKPIFTIEDATVAKSYLFPPVHIGHGNVEEGFKLSDHVIEGEVSLEGQKHFYIELPAAVAVPKKEHQEIIMYFTTQDPTRVQHLIGKALKIPYNKIVVKVKRLGAGYGGKISLPNMIGLPVVIAANKLNRPVRYCMTREEDMIMLGGRHPYLFKYKVGFSNEGKLLALETDMYSNGGYSSDCTFDVMDVTIRKAGEPYIVPNVKVTGYCLRTNLPTNTAFRAFGSPQANFWVETMMNRIATILNMPQEKIREINLQPEGYVTYYGQEIKPNSLARCWSECLEKSNYYQRKKEADIFNENNRWKKRGIAVMPLHYGIVVTQLPFNYGNALIHINVDGSVIVNHGGTEMGQGLHIKMIQIASRCLNLPISYIHISETSTDKVPNTHLTSASVNTDIFGMAVKNGCETLLERLKPYIEKQPTGTWEEWVMTAFMDRVNLSATGYYKFSDIPYTPSKREGLFYYYIISAATCSEIELDCLTGAHKVLRSDFFIDAGRSINPAIDMGQIEGGFVQGIGMLTTEEWKVSKTGEIVNRGARTYRIPSAADIPYELNVHFLKDPPTDKGLYSSKGLGEVAVCFAVSIVMAIKNAVHSARVEQSLTGDVSFNSPMTIDKIRMACSDIFTNTIKQ